MLVVGTFTAYPALEALRVGMPNIHPRNDDEKLNAGRPNVVAAYGRTVCAMIARMAMFHQCHHYHWNQPLKIHWQAQKAISLQHMNPERRKGSTVWTKTRTLPTCAPIQMPVVMAVVHWHHIQAIVDIADIGKMSSPCQSECPCPVCFTFDGNVCLLMLHVVA